MRRMASPAATGNGPITVRRHRRRSLMALDARRARGPTAPIIGATVAVAFEWILRGKATKAGADAAQGILDQDNAAGL